ncbi:hypothetical protein [Streptomyces sp. NPDC050388]|uniref:hypothetical protein n=1 Tax=Streptomyces sp. NPDC050388 TaxID=3155781 RepID=UPI003435B669
MPARPVRARVPVRVRVRVRRRTSPAGEAGVRDTRHDLALEEAEAARDRQAARRGR